jgi:hypothetical protein
VANRTWRIDTEEGRVLPDMAAVPVDASGWMRGNASVGGQIYTSVGLPCAQAS